MPIFYDRRQRQKNSVEGQWRLVSNRCHIYVRVGHIKPSTSVRREDEFRKRRRAWQCFGFLEQGDCSRFDKKHQKEKSSMRETTREFVRPRAPDFFWRLYRNAILPRLNGPCQLRNFRHFKRDPLSSQRL